MKITCPSCQNTYQLADGTLGATGRKVRCTNCGTVWHALPGSDESFDAGPDPIEAAAARFREPSVDEWKAALSDGDGPSEAAPETAAADDAPPDETVSGGGTVVPFRPREADGAAEAAETADAQASAPEPKAETTLEADPPGFEPQKRKAKTQKQKRKPLARPAARSRFNAATFAIAGAATFALFVLVGAFVGREQVVRVFPDFASLYEVVGLHVNLRGLDFSDVITQREMDGGTPVLVIEGMITNVAKEQRPVPSLRFALMSAAEREVYAWTMEPPKPRLEPGEQLRFKSRLPAPPDAAVDAVVRFTDQRGP